jgi:hypothetical protein
LIILKKRGEKGKKGKKREKKEKKGKKGRDEPTLRVNKQMCAILTAYFMLWNIVEYCLTNNCRELIS